MLPFWAYTTLSNTSLSKAMTDDSPLYQFNFNFALKRNYR